MLYPAPQHFIAVAVAIAVAAIRGIRLDVKPFGGLIGASSGNQRIAKPLVKGAVIGLIAVRPAPALICERSASVMVMMFTTPPIAPEP
jgi:hypothetical protein